MTLVPLFMDISEDFEDFDHLFDDDFAFGVYPHEITTTRYRRPSSSPRLHILAQPRKRLIPYVPRRPASGSFVGNGNENDGSSAVCNNSNTSSNNSSSSSSINSSSNTGGGIITTATTGGERNVGRGESSGKDAAAVIAALKGKLMGGAAATIGAGDGQGHSSIFNHSVIGKDGFQVCMDVQQFKPNELIVKTIDNCVIVEGKHEEREDDHGLITRHFIRKYILPKGFDTKDVVSTLSSDGILTVKAPPQTKNDDRNERIIQIQQTGPAHLTVVKNNPKEVAASAAAAAATAGASVTAAVPVTNNLDDTKTTTTTTKTIDKSTAAVESIGNDVAAGDSTPTVAAAAAAATNTVDASASATATSSSNTTTNSIENGEGGNNGEKSNNEKMEE